MSNITRINVRCVNFRWNLSILPRRHLETIFLESHFLKSWVYVYTFLSLYELFFIGFCYRQISFIIYIPSKNTLLAFKKSLYSKIHRACILTFKRLIMSIVFFVYSLLSIPDATLSYFQLVIYLSNDISKYPHPQFQNNFLNFISWNLNSLAKDNLHPVSLIDAHNSLCYYDLISICKTSLNASVELPETLLDEYTFVPANNPANMIRDGVGLFYKNALPVVIRNDLSFDESIVVELKFDREKK